MENLKINLKKLLTKPQQLAPGHRSCRGCAMPIIVRSILRATDFPIVVVNATSCLEVTTTLFPQTSWNIPWLHNAFENAPATMSGVIGVYRNLKKQGKFPQEVKFVVFGGDGSTYDIGLQSMSGSWERRDDFLYVCYDNQAYQNTGNQRSSATPLGAVTTTTPTGNARRGKLEKRKNIIEIAAAHDLPYIAQANIYHWNDLYRKAKKAFQISGPTFLNVLSPCVAGWKYDPALTVELSRLATETCFWPIFEVEEGEYKINYQPKKKINLEQFLKPQKRFRHLFEPENAGVLEELKKNVNQEWEKLLKKIN